MAFDATVLAGLLIALGEVTIVLAAAWGVDRIASTRCRPAVRLALWTLIAIRLVAPAGLWRWPGAELVVADPGVATAIAPAGWPLLMVAAVWIGGVVMLAARWAWIGAAARRRRRRVVPDPTLAALLERVARRVGLRRRPVVLEDPAAPTPYVSGAFRPRLVLPFDWPHWSADTLDHALSHELMHLKRRDLLVEAFWMVIAAAYWFHPLVHLARRRAHDAREAACDAAVAALVGPAYRLTLLRVLAVSAGEAPALAASHGWHPAIERLRALERWPAPPSRRRRIAAVLAAMVAAAIASASLAALAPSSGAMALLDRLVDPVSRQELGAGSLHLRYALIQQQTSGAGR